jgi:phospholipase/carboxylesterase
MKPIRSALDHRIIVPKRTTASSHPTILMLHGRGADEEDLLGLAQYFDSAWLILSARAPFAFSPGGGYTWYDVGTVGTPEPAMFRTSYDKLSTFLDDALNGYPVDPKRLYLLGFSMGTVMSYALALTRPRLFRGVMANSGYVPEDTHLAFLWHELDDLDIFIAHGIFDPVIPIGFARRAKELFAKSNAHLTYREYPMAHQISEESLSDVVAWLNQRMNTQPA